MKLFCFVAILLIAVSQVAGYITFNFQGDSPQLLASYQGTVGPNDPATERDGFYVPRNSSAISFELSASASMSVCASPDSLVQNIDNCPPGNRLEFVFDNATQTYSAQASFFGETTSNKNSSQNLYLLLDRTYYITVALNESVELSGNSTDFTLQVYSTGACKNDEIYTGNSCTKSLDTFSLADKKENNLAISASSNNLYLIDTTTVTENVVSITLEVTFPSSSSSAFASVTYPSIYLRRGAAPLYANGSSNSDDTIVISSGTQQVISYSIENPIPDTVGWFIAFDSSDATTAALLITYDSCSGVLIGANCSINPLDLATYFSQSSEGLLLAVNNTGKVDYFYWFSNHLIVGAADREYKNNPPNLYASTSTPSNTSYLYSDVDSDVPAHLLNVVILTNPTYYYIAVYSTDNYWIWYGRPCAGNCTSLTTGLDDAICLECSGHGTCQTDQGVCTCDKGYKNFACSTRGLAIIWIILISIGGAIVLALAIGIPVGCYIKNRKRARYERV